MFFDQFAKRSHLIDGKLFLPIGEFQSLDCVVVDFEEGSCLTERLDDNCVGLIENGVLYGTKANGFSPKLDVSIGGMTVVAGNL